MARVGIHVPLAAADVQPDTMLRFARTAQQAGAAGLWTLDRLVFNNQEPLLALAAAAAVTSNLDLGVAVLLATLRPPAMLAKMAATLDQISGGRVILGLGVGSRPDDFAAAEVPFEHRGSRLEEAIDIFKLAWSGQPVKYSGRFYNIDVGSIGPRPARGGSLPIWLGGGSTEAALKRIGRIADGYIASSSGGPDGFRQNWDKIARYAGEAGRASQLTAAALIYVCVDDDVARAEEIAAGYFNYYYGGRRPGRGGAIVGPPDQCIRALNEYVRAGVAYPIIGSPTADVRYLERFCEKVLPHLEV